MSTHSASGTAFVADLARRLGQGAAAPPELLARLEASADPAAFSGVFAPDSAAGVADVLAACSAENWPVVPLGAATWWQPGRRGADGDAEAEADGLPPLLLSTARLNHITEHEPADLVIGVQAGLPLEGLAAALADKQQWLPLDPPTAPEATIGAIAALGEAGPLRAAHGTPRDMALGIEIATGDGRLLRFGGRVVKNVAGYDGVRLAVGSRGTLGVITGIFLRVRGAPRIDLTLAIPCGRGLEGARRGAELALAVRSAAECDAIELVSPPVTDALASTPATGEWTVLVRLLGREAAVAEGADRVRAASSGHSSGTVAEAQAAIWQALARMEAEARTALRLSGPATGLADGVTAAESLAGGSATRGSGMSDGWKVAAHAGSGIVRLWHAGPRPVTGDLRESLRRLGNAAGEGAWSLRFDRYDPARIPATEPHMNAASRAQADAIAALTARIRAAFDPAGILPAAGAAAAGEAEV